MDMAYQGENEQVIIRRSGNIVFRVDETATAALLGIVLAASGQTDGGKVSKD